MHWVNGVNILVWYINTNANRGYIDNSKIINFVVKYIYIWYITLKIQLY